MISVEGAGRRLIRAALVVVALAWPVIALLSLFDTARAIGLGHALTGGMAWVAPWAMRSGDWASVIPSAFAMLSNALDVAAVALGAACLGRHRRLPAWALVAVSLANFALSAAHGAIDPVPAASMAAAVALAVAGTRGVI